MSVYISNIGNDSLLLIVEWLKKESAFTRESIVYCLHACVDSHLSRLQDPTEVLEVMHFLTHLCEGTRNPLFIVSPNLGVLLLLLAA